MSEKINNSNEYENPYQESARLKREWATTTADTDPSFKEYFTAEAEKDEAMIEHQKEEDLSKRLGFNTFEVTGGVLSEKAAESHLIAEEKSRQEIAEDLAAARAKLDELYSEGLGGGEYRYLSKSLSEVLPRYDSKEE